MSTGSCLCGNVTWNFSGDSEATYHCHCSMCRKAHGAAFGTYFYVSADRFAWTSATDIIRHYQSSRSLIRSFCGKCGSVVPNSEVLEDTGEFFFIPAGCHDDGPSADCHIFVASKAPWMEISDELPQHDALPPGIEEKPCDSKHRSAPTDGILRGSCLCGVVEYHITDSIRALYNCHCQRCRRARAAAFTTNGFTSSNGIRFTKGKEHLASYKLPDARYFTQVFCDTCGSGLPRIDESRQIAVIPFGSLDDDPRQFPSANIYVAHKAKWYTLCTNLPAFEEGPD